MSTDNKSAYDSNIYDEHIVNVLPYYREYHDQIIDLVQICKQDPIDWLDAGCGTGTLASRVLEKEQNVRFTLCDPSEKMLNEAEKKLKDKNIRFIKAASHEFDHDSEYDVITAVQSHHYYRPDERARAVSNCYRALRNGGIFITFENIRMSSETSDTMPHVGSVCFDGDDDKLDDTFEFFTTALSERKQKFASMGIGSFKEYVQHNQDTPALLLVIDNFTAFYENYDKYDDDLTVLTREGVSYGIYTVITANTSGDLRSRLRQNFNTGIGLQMPDKFEYEAVVGDRTEILPEAKTPGRGLIKAPAGVEFQVALPIREKDGLSVAQSIKKELASLDVDAAGKGAKKPGQVLESLSIDELLKETKDLPENMFAIGKSIDGETTLTLNMDSEYCISVIGLGKTGKTNLLKALAKTGVSKKDDVIIFDGKSEELKDFAKKTKVADYVTDEEGLFKLMQDKIVPEFGNRNKIVNEAKEAGADVAEAMKDQKRILILINDYTAFIEAVYSENFGMSGFFETALEKGRDHKIQFVAALTPDDVSDCGRYQVSRQFVSMESGVNMGGLFDQQNVLHWEMSSADAVRQLQAGYGYALSESGAPLRMLTPLV